MRRIFAKTVACLLFLAGIAVIGVWFCFLNIPIGTGSSTTIFEVKPGQSFKTVMVRMSAQGIIQYPMIWYSLGRILGYDYRIKVGEYELNSSLKPLEVFSILISGKSLSWPFTVSEGLNIYEIAQLYEKQGLGSKDEFLRLCRDPQFIRDLTGRNLFSLEGYLFPETYLITKYTDPKSLIRMMTQNFKRVFSSLQSETSRVVGSTHQIVILASIIEKETGAPNERGLISSVFHNRLRKRMKLQADPTVLYGIWDQTGHYKINITRFDLTNPTRYNTYTRAGLPFGPIANPGREALLAALRPATSGWLYFVSRNDGTHVFSETYEEHAKKVRQFQIEQSARQGRSWRDLSRDIKKTTSSRSH